MMIDNLEKNIHAQIVELNKHELYEKINSLESLGFFMERHSFAVLDFMSLAKRLQAEFSPINRFWTPPKHKEISRFINEIILAEESDELPNGTHMSHFEMYCEAMTEVGSSDRVVRNFVNELLRQQSLDGALERAYVPESAKRFIIGTYTMIEGRGVHEVASAFCFGREKIIPSMFLNLLNKMDIGEESAPMFYYYLKRHIEIDGDEHGPLAEKMLAQLCGQDAKKWMEAESAAREAINLRLNFWSDIQKEWKSFQQKTDFVPISSIN